MSIRRLKDGGYRLRYNARGTRDGGQRQETLRGVSFAEAKRIHDLRIAGRRSPETADLALRDPLVTDAIVYFVAQPSGGMLRIGTTGDGPRRRRAHSERRDVIYLGDVDGSYDVEAAWFIRFRHLRIWPDRSWLRMTDELLQRIAIEVAASAVDRTSRLARNLHSVVEVFYP
jgi:hypothetical protein